MAEASEAGCVHGVARPGEPCVACAAESAGGCPGCGHVGRPGARFCTRCGRPTERSGPDTENRPATVLFAGLRGIGALADRLSAGELHGAMSDLMRLLSGAVAAHGGTVDRYTAEGIKAHFGAPTALERHARHACLAALDAVEALARFAEEIRREHGLEVGPCAGVASGEIVFGPVGDAGGNVSAHGRTAALAARLQRIASPGQVLLADETADLVGGHFGLTDLGRFWIRGFADPVRVHALSPPPESVPAAPGSGAGDLLVGREAELRRLRDALARTRAERGLRVVLLSGEAGIGKTRLAREFARVAEAAGFAVTSVASAERDCDTPLAVARSLLREVLGVPPSADPSEARDRIAGRLLLRNDEMREYLPLVHEFLGFGDGGPPRALDGRTEELAAFARNFATSARDGGDEAWIWDDHHWTDEVTDRLLRSWLDPPATRPMLLLVIRRTDSGPAPPWVDLPCVIDRIHLGPLPRGQVDAIVLAQLGHDPELDVARERIADRAGGNPLFAEQLVRKFLDSGALEGEPGRRRISRTDALDDLPANLGALIAARIDALAPRDRRIARAAAVLGSTFPEPLLQRMTNLPAITVAESLHRLHRAEIVEHLGEGQHRFRHLLVRDGILRVMQRPERARLHASAAAAAEAAVAVEAEGSSPVAPAVIAAHWEEAGEPGRAAAWHHRSALLARTIDPQRAARLWLRALDLLGPEPTAPGDLRTVVAAALGVLGLGWFAGLSRNQATAIYLRGSDAARRLREPAAERRLDGAYASTAGFGGSAGEARRILETAEPGPALETPAAAVARAAHRASALYAIGELHRSRAEADAAAATAERHGLDRPVSIDIVRGLSRSIMGEFSDARSILDAALERARAGGRLIDLVSALLACCRAEAEAGEPAGTRVEACRDLLGRTRPVGGEPLAALILGTLGAVQLRDGDAGGARASLEEAWSIVEPLDPRPPFVDVLSRLALARLADGATGEAILAANRARALGEEIGGSIFAIDSSLRWAAIALAGAAAPVAEVVAHLAAARSRAVACGARSREPMLGLCLAAARRRLGDTAGARRDVEAARRALGRMGHARLGEIRDDTDPWVGIPLF